MKYLRRVSFIKNYLSISNVEKLFLLFQLNIPSLGFTPLINTPKLAHDHDEYVQADEYLAGIEVYKKLITNLGDI